MSSCEQCNKLSAEVERLKAQNAKIFQALSVVNASKKHKEQLIDATLDLMRFRHENHLKEKEKINEQITRVKNRTIASVQKNVPKQLEEYGQLFHYLLTETKKYEVLTQISKNAKQELETTKLELDGFKMYVSQLIADRDDAKNRITTISEELSSVRKELKSLKTKNRIHEKQKSVRSDIFAHQRRVQGGVKNALSKLRTKYDNEPIFDSNLSEVLKILECLEASFKKESLLSKENINSDVTEVKPLMSPKSEISSGYCSSTTSPWSNPSPTGFQEAKTSHDVEKSLPQFSILCDMEGHFNIKRSASIDSTTTNASTSCPSSSLHQNRRLSSRTKSLESQLSQPESIDEEVERMVTSEASDTEDLWSTSPMMTYDSSNETDDKSHNVNNSSKQTSREHIVRSTSLTCQTKSIFDPEEKGTCDNSKSNNDNKKPTSKENESVENDLSLSEGSKKHTQNSSLCNVKSLTTFLNDNSLLEEISEENTGESPILSSLTDSTDTIEERPPKKRIEVLPYLSDYEDTIERRSLKNEVKISSGKSQNLPDLTDSEGQIEQNQAKNKETMLFGRSPVSPHSSDDASKLKMSKNKVEILFRENTISTDLSGDDREYDKEKTNRDENLAAVNSGKENIRTEGKGKTRVFRVECNVKQESLLITSEILKSKNVDKCGNNQRNQQAKSDVKVAQENTKYLRDKQSKRHSVTGDLLNHLSESEGQEEDCEKQIQTERIVRRSRRLSEASTNKNVHKEDGTNSDKEWRNHLEDNSEKQLNERNSKRPKGNCSIKDTFDIKENLKNVKTSLVENTIVEQKNDTSSALENLNKEIKRSKQKETSLDEIERDLDIESIEKEVQEDQNGDLSEKIVPSKEKSSITSLFDQGLAKNIEINGTNQRKKTLRELEMELDSKVDENIKDGDMNKQVELVKEKNLFAKNVEEKLTLNGTNKREKTLRELETKFDADVNGKTGIRDGCADNTSKQIELNNTNQASKCMMDCTSKTTSNCLIEMDESDNVNEKENSSAKPRYKSLPEFLKAEKEKNKIHSLAVNNSCELDLQRNVRSKSSVKEDKHQISDVNNVNKIVRTYGRSKLRKEHVDMRKCHQSEILSHPDNKILEKIVNKHEFTNKNVSNHKPANVMSWKSTHGPVQFKLKTARRSVSQTKVAFSIESDEDCAETHKSEMKTSSKIQNISKKKETMEKIQIGNEKNMQNKVLNMSSSNPNDLVELHKFNEISKKSIRNPIVFVSSAESTKHDKKKSNFSSSNHEDLTEVTEKCEKSIPNPVVSVRSAENTMHDKKKSNFSFFNHKDRIELHKITKKCEKSIPNSVDVVSSTENTQKPEKKNRRKVVTEVSDFPVENIDEILQKMNFLTSFPFINEIPPTPPRPLTSGTGFKNYNGYGQSSETAISDGVKLDMHAGHQFEKLSKSNRKDENENKSVPTLNKTSSILEVKNDGIIQPINRVNNQIHLNETTPRTDVIVTDECLQTQNKLSNTPDNIFVKNLKADTTHSNESTLRMDVTITHEPLRTQNNISNTFENTLLKIDRSDDVNKINGDTSSFDEPFIGPIKPIDLQEKSKPVSIYDDGDHKTFNLFEDVENNDDTVFTTILKKDNIPKSVNNVGTNINDTIDVNAFVEPSKMVRNSPNKLKVSSHLPISNISSVLTHLPQNGLVQESITKMQPHIPKVHDEKITVRYDNSHKKLNRINFEKNVEVDHEVREVAVAHCENNVGFCKTKNQTEFVSMKNVKQLCLNGQYEHFVNVKINETNNASFYKTENQVESDVTQVEANSYSNVFSFYNAGSNETNQKRKADSDNDESDTSKKVKLDNNPLGIDGKLVIDTTNLNKYTKLLTSSVQQLEIELDSMSKPSYVQTYNELLNKVLNTLFNLNLKSSTQFHTELTSLVDKVDHVPHNVLSKMIIASFKNDQLVENTRDLSTQQTQLFCFISMLDRKHADFVDEFLVILCETIILHGETLLSSIVMCYVELYVTICRWKNKPHSVLALIFDTIYFYKKRMLDIVSSIMNKWPAVYPPQTECVLFQVISFCFLNETSDPKTRFFCDINKVKFLVRKKYNYCLQLTQVSLLETLMNTLSQSGRGCCMSSCVEKAFVLLSKCWRPNEDVFRVVLGQYLMPTVERSLAEGNVAVFISGVRLIGMIGKSFPRSSSQLPIHNILQFLKHLLSHKNLVTSPPPYPQLRLAIGTSLTYLASHNLMDVVSVLNSIDWTDEEIAALTSDVTCKVLVSKHVDWWREYLKKTNESELVQPC